MTPEELVQLALEARQRAYAPYSNYLVGAAVLAGLGVQWIEQCIRNRVSAKNSVSWGLACLSLLLAAELLLAARALDLGLLLEGGDDHDHVAPFLLRGVLHEADVLDVLSQLLQQPEAQFRAALLPSCLL